jgi:hypothetical protein
LPEAMTVTAGLGTAVGDGLRVDVGSGVRVRVDVGGEVRVRVGVEVGEFCNGVERPAAQDVNIPNITQIGNTTRKKCLFMIIILQWEKSPGILDGKIKLWRLSG